MLIAREKVKGFIGSRCQNSLYVGCSRVIIHSQLQYDLTAVLESSPATAGSRTTCRSEAEAMILLISLSPTLQKVLMGRQLHKLKGTDFGLSCPYVKSVTVIALYRAEKWLIFIASFCLLFNYFQFLYKHNCTTETQLIFENGSSEEGKYINK